MDYRQGKCSSCGAEYKIPASFQHNAAKCKECGGVVNIGPVTSDKPSEPAKEIPARQFAGKRPEEDAPKKKSGTLDRLKAERASAGGGDAKKKSGTLDRLKAQRSAGAKPAAAKPVAKPTAKPGAKSGGKTPVKAGAAAGTSRSRSGGAAAKRRSSRRGGDDDGEDGGGRASRRGGRAQKQKPNMALFAIGAVLLLGGGAAAFFMMGNDGDTQAKETDETAQAEGTETPMDETVDDGAMDEGAETPEDTATDEGTDEGADEGAEDAAETPEEKPEKPKGDPSAVDFAQYPDFGAPNGVSAADWTSVTEAVELFLADDGARSMRALRGLETEGPKAIPAMLNAMKSLNYGDEKESNLGYSLQKAMTKIAHGSNYGWYDGVDDTPHYQKKKVVEAWIKMWIQADEDIEAWIKFAKLDEKAPDEAAMVRETYVAAGAAVTDDSDLDLDID